MSIVKVWATGTSHDPASVEKFLESTKIRASTVSTNDKVDRSLEKQASRGSHALPRRRLTGRATPRTLSCTALGGATQDPVGLPESPTDLNMPDTDCNMMMTGRMAHVRLVESIPRPHIPWTLFFRRHDKSAYSHGVAHISVPALYLQ